MKYRVLASVLILFALVIGLAVIQQNEASAADSSMKAIRGVSQSWGENPANQRSASVAAVVIALIFIWWQPLTEQWGKWTKLVLLAGVALGLSACNTGAPPGAAVVENRGNARVFTTTPNEVTFVIELVRPDQKEVIGTTPTLPTFEKQADRISYWKSKQNQDLAAVNIAIPQYCYKVSTIVQACNGYQDSIMVVVVSLEPISKTWDVPANTCTSPATSEQLAAAFSMQSLEADGGSLGVYTGATVRARILPEDAALFLSTYRNSFDTTRQVNVGRPLSDIVNTDIQASIQRILYAEYGSRSIVEQNRAIPAITEKAQAELQGEYKPKGVTIEFFGLRGGNVYDNCLIQEGFDASAKRASDLEQAKADATRQGFDLQRQKDQANAQATMTVVANNTNLDYQNKQLEYQRALAAILTSNPMLIVQKLAEKWNGVLPQIIGQTNSIPMIPFDLGTPSAVTPTPVP